jgi:hypothetical protein
MWLMPFASVGNESLLMDFLYHSARVSYSPDSAFMHRIHRVFAKLLLIINALTDEDYGPALVSLFVCLFVEAERSGASLL